MAAIGVANEAFQQGMAKLEEAARFTAAIGCPRMGTWIMPSTETPKDELRKTYLARFQAVAQVLAKARQLCRQRQRPAGTRRATARSRQPRPTRDGPAPARNAPPPAEIGGQPSSTPRARAEASVSSSVR